MSRFGPEPPPPRLAEALRALPRELAPPDDLWPDIRSRLRTGKRSHRPSVNLLAAAALILVVLSAGITAIVMRHEAPHRSPLSRTPGAAVAAGYPGAIAQVAASYAHQRSALPAEARATVDANLQVIDRAIAEIELRLVRNPRNATLIQLLLASYEQKLALLQQGTRMSSSL